MTQASTSPIVEEFLVKPSQVAPTLFVGLGGAGCKLVNRVYTQLARRPDFNERYRELSKFAYVDTNIHDLEKYREVGDDLFLVSDFEKAEYSRLAAGKAYLDPDDYFTQWVPQNYRFRSGDTAGAGQIRIESRLGVYYQIKHKDFVARFRKLFADLKDQAHGHRRLDSSEIRIVIAYSVAGGTGSGSHLPVAYLLRDLAAQFGKPLIFGVAALSSVFEDKVGANRDGIFANGYAALKETEYLMKLGAPESKFFPEDGTRVLHYNPSDPSRRTVNTKPFEVLWIIDRPESFAVDDVLGAAGDALFLQLYTPIYGEQAGDFDNYTQHQRFLVPYDFEAKNIPGYTSFYGALGAAVLHVPDRTLLRYCARRGGIAVVENSFLQGIPPEDVYRHVSKSFFEIEALDGSGRQVKESDFERRAASERERLRNRLFQKRVRMLAHAEIEADSDVEFFTKVFRHGHGFRVLPGPDGGVRSVDAAAMAVASPPKAISNLLNFKNRLSTEAGKLGLSMAHFALNALESSSGKGSGSRWLCKVYEQARQEIEDSVQEEGEAWASERESATTANKSVKALVGLEKDTVSEKTSRSELEDQIKYIEGKGRKKISTLLDRSERMAPAGLDWTPGFAWLDGLEFISSPDALTTNLVERRYALLSVLDTVEALVGACNEEKKKRETAAEKDAEAAKNERQAASATPAVAEEELIGKENIRARTRTALEDAVRRIEGALFDAYRTKLDSFQKKIVAHAAVFTDLQEQFAALRAHETAEAEKLRVQGSKDDTDAFLLDGEALQIESGRRMWDFYFEDKIRSLPALHLSSNKTLAQTIAVSIDRLAAGRLRGEGTPGDALSKLYAEVTNEIAEALRHKIQGDLRSSIEADRYGITLLEALLLEIKYRALYLTNREKVDDGNTDAVGQLIAATRGEADINVRNPIHRDYLRDKLKRLIKEKSDLLCYLDEKHLSQGGVRPDEVFLAAVHEELYGGLLKEVMDESLGLKPPKVITKDVEDRKQVVFYRAVLNVPLYVFGRLRELRACYYQFKGLAKRSKVLHIDKNWEDTLPDLDPASVEEAHRQQRIRESVLDFATLLSVPQKLIFDSFVTEEERAEIKCRNDRLDVKWVGDGKKGSLAGEKSYGIADADTCIYWREESGRHGERVWVIRMPLEERIRRIEWDSSDPDELTGEEPVIGSSLGEAVLRVPEILASSPELYRSYRETCTMVREGRVPRVIQSLIRLPGAWRRHREGLRTRYGRNPIEEQQRVLEDLENVELKLTSALEQLYDTLDLRRRESGLRVDPISIDEPAGAAPREPREFVTDEVDPVSQSIRLLYDFKNSLRSTPGLPRGERRGHGLFSALSPEDMKNRLKR